MDPKKLIEMLTKNPAAGAAAGGLAGSLLGNVLAGGGGGGGGKLGKKALKYGGLAAIGYVAYQAYQKHQAQKTGAPAAGTSMPPLGSIPQPTALPKPVPAAFDLEAPANAGSAVRVLQAMIAASKADGVLDPVERDRIFGRISELNLSAAEQDEVLGMLTRPVDLDAIVRGVNTRELAMEIYAAAAMACSPASRAERAWLDMLAARLGLENDLTLEVDRHVESLPQS